MGNEFFQLKLSNDETEDFQAGVRAGRAHLQYVLQGLRVQGILGASRQGNVRVRTSWFNVLI